MTQEELAEAHWDNGNEHYAAGRLDQAITEWRAGVRADPDNADLHYNLGLALSDVGQEQEAVERWREAVRLCPDLYEPHIHLVIVLTKGLKAGRRTAEWREVRHLCREALALDPSNAGQRLYLLNVKSMAEWELGDRRAAVRTAQALLEAAPDNQGAYESLALMQQRLGHWRGMWRTMTAMCELPNIDLSAYDECGRRARLFGILTLLVGGLLLFRKLNQGR